MSFPKLIVAMIVGGLSGVLAAQIGYEVTDVGYWTVVLPPAAVVAILLNID